MIRTRIQFKRLWQPRRKIYRPRTVQVHQRSILRTVRKYTGGTSRILHRGLFSQSIFIEEWEFRLPHCQDIRRVRSADQFGASWLSIEVPFTRLYKGFDLVVVIDVNNMDIAEVDLAIGLLYNVRAKDDLWPGRMSLSALLAFNAIIGHRS